MLNTIRCFLDDERGVTAIEYALIATLIVLVLLVGVIATSNQVSALYNDVAQKLVAAMNTGG